MIFLIYIFLDLWPKRQQLRGFRNLSNISPCLDRWDIQTSISPPMKKYWGLLKENTELLTEIPKKVIFLSRDHKRN